MIQVNYIPYNYFRKLEKLKKELDLELSLSAHSNGFLKITINLLEDEEITKSYDTWLSYNNWEENSRIYSEIIQVNSSLSFILYYESFTVGGCNGRVNTDTENEIDIENNTLTEQQIRQDQRGFRIQLKKLLYKNSSNTVLDILMVDESTLTTDGKLVEEIWNDFLENYKNMQTLIEDTTASSLFSQLLYKGNSVLSDEEDTYDESPPVKPRK